MQEANQISVQEENSSYIPFLQKYSRGKWLSGLVIVIFAVGGIYFLNDFYVSKTSQRTSGITTPTPTLSLIDWVVYIDEFNEYSVQYPKGWKIKDYTVGIEEIVAIYPAGNWKTPVGLPPQLDSHIAIKVLENPDNYEIEDFVNRKLADLINSPFQPTNLDGEPAKRTSLSNNALYYQQKQFKHEDVLAKRDKFIYQIQLNKAGGKPIGEELFTQFLSKFKFLKQKQLLTSCENNVSSLCAFVSEIRSLIAVQNFQKLLEYQKQEEVTCTNIIEPFAIPCEGELEGSEVQRFYIERNQSEGSYFTKTKAVDYLKKYVSEYGPFVYHGLLFDENKGGIVVYTSSKKQLFAIYIYKSGQNWIIGMVDGLISDDFLNLSRWQLRYLYNRAQR